MSRYIQLPSKPLTFGPGLGRLEQSFNGVFKDFSKYFEDFLPSQSIIKIECYPISSKEKLKFEIDSETKNILVILEVPGIKKEDIQISMVNYELTIQTKTKKGEEERFITYINPLKYVMNTNENIKAKVEDGELVISIPPYTSLPIQIE